MMLFRVLQPPSVLSNKARNSCNEEIQPWLTAEGSISDMLGICSMLVTLTAEVPAKSKDDAPDHLIH